MTAEYSLLPASTGERTAREARDRQAAGAHGRDPAPHRPGCARGGRLRGARRAHALARLRRPAGRRRHALRGDQRRLGGRTPGARPLRARGRRCPAPSRRSPSASSTAGPLLDLDYSEDSTADVDLNVVMTGDGRFVDVQATAEREPFFARRARRAARARGRGHRAGSVPSRSGGRPGRTCLTSALGGFVVAAAWPRPLSVERIGIERELREREAVFGRTCSYPLVSALFTLISAYAWTDFRLRRGLGSRRPDPDRRAGRDRDRLPRRRRDHPPGLTVRGLTTAATLWIAAAIGMACGAGYYWAAVIGTALALVTLWSAPPSRERGCSLTSRAAGG